MRINRLNTDNNNPSDNIKELTIYHYFQNNNNNNNNNINNNNNNNSNNNNKNINNNSFSTKNQTNINTTDLSDDDYILELHRKLAEKREIRRISEQGVKLLNVRVRCLKEENKKTLAKIDVTHKKIKEKEMALEYHRSRSQEKKDFLQRKEDNLKLLKQKNQYQKLVTQKNILNSRENLILQNQIKGQQLKAEKIDNENKRKVNELNTKIFKKNKIEVLRNQSQFNSQKKKIIKITKKEKLIKDLEKKINLELQKKKEFDDELNKLMDMEKEILARILQNNEMQRKLIEDFGKDSTGCGYKKGSIMTLNNNNISCIKGNEPFDDDYDDEDIKDF